MKYSALIPMKALHLAKSRLAPHLSPQQRETLVLEMLQHVISTLDESELFEQIYVVSADPSVLELIQYWGAEPLRETQPGHNPALQEAAHTIVARTAWRHKEYATSVRCREQGMLERAGSATYLRQDEGLLTISADLPLLARADLVALLQEAEHSQVVLAGSSDGTGTNALLTRPPLALPYLFGPNSLPAYSQAARTRQLSYTLLHNAHLALDIDTLADLEHLENAWPNPARFAI